ncbi:MAG: glycoside hydrolase family 78 protein [Bacteroidales bacterium]|nr:glycoside hydrolase family 78 protein [Bacteroidales bacterium]
MKRLIFFIIIAATLTSCGTKIQLSNLTVEQQDGSRALATNQPRFSWQYESEYDNVKQVDYRIVVASTEQNAKDGIGDLWDSKVVESNKMLYIQYAGQELHSRDIAYWKVFATVTYGKNEKKTSIESDVKSFEISLMNENDWQAKWIGREFDDDILKGKTRIAARYLRKTFDLNDEISKARLYISGLGQYSAYINGAEVAPDELLKPAISDYTKRVYFNTYDVTSMLNKGENAIGVTLEGGRFTTIRYDSLYLEWGGINHAIHYGKPQLLLQLEVTYKDGTSAMINSDESWKITNNGPIRTANEFDGETYDANMDLGEWTKIGYDDSNWLPVEIVDAPEGKLNAQPNPNIMVQDKIRPVAIFKKGNARIVDMGQNMVGVLDIKVRNQQAGDTITMRFAETLTADSLIYIDNLRSAEATDHYIMNGSNAQWHPMFTYHGFRFVEISGLRSEPTLDDFEGLVFYDAMPTTGSFETSNEIINAVYRNAYWGIRGNYRSMPTDCPQRDERMGWTGDRTTGCYGESYIFGNHQLYAKWLCDLDDSQWPSGSISDVAPAYWRRYTDNMTWPGAFITAAEMLYTRFGDEEPIRQHYDAMKRWMVHMKEKYAVDGIITRDCYGDWCMPPESPEMIHSKDTSRITSAEVISTPFYCYLAGKMAKFADMLGYSEDVNYFNNEIATTTASYNEKYLNKETGRYSNNTVTANILPLWFGMVPTELEDKVFANIIDKTEKDFGGHVSTGVVGIQQLMRTLTERGRGDLALHIASNDSYPSWGYMYRNGATTIWELWNGNTADPSMNSGNHVMLLGDLILWEYEYLGGIRALEPGYSKIQLKPYPIEGLEYVNCSYKSVSGLIESNWKVNGNQFEWDIVIPANTTAEVWLPTSDGYQKQTIGSGKHKLSSKIK